MTTATRDPQFTTTRRLPTHTVWQEQQGIPVHHGYYIEDLRTVEVGDWKARGVKAAFIQLEGMPGVTEIRVTEVSAGQTTPPYKLGYDEIVYVLSGNGITSIWAADEKAKKSFEWNAHSMFRIPRHHTFQFTNTRGNVPVRLMHFNYSPPAFTGSNDPNFFFNNPYTEPAQPLEEIFSQAKVENIGAPEGRDPYMWYGNFFPDMKAWDKLAEYGARGAGGHHVQFTFPNTEINGHRSIFEPLRYKKGHRHGPGVSIVIPLGEGYSIMWKEGEEKVVVPWHECSFFTPPDMWFHQHFNTGTTPARYLALHAGPAFSRTERVADLSRDQIEYTQEDPWVREMFEKELAKQNAKSGMPAQCYTDPNFKFEFKQEYAKPM